MASYTDQRNALFATKDPKDKSAPKTKKPAALRKAPKKPTTLGGPSVNSQVRKVVSQSEHRVNADALFAAGEALMPPRKTGFAALMAKKPNPLFAATEYAKAGAAYAAAGAPQQALMAHLKAADCHIAVEAYSSAAKELENARKAEADPARKAALGVRAA
eukprot:CAMPEP_0119278896 /NCGR_PEP_ID=MMETSP1329-20130426/19883_1 /TAXON_ID=114041 /ORGANISM="Genus nov. species nov., Strain RCC1024" /LENGTH=159 /DNA_ID=CAMNT_0007279425 /DNA_START=207 /DNA_END=683 /DNA_ORIENTATION=+